MKRISLLILTLLLCASSSWAYIAKSNSQIDTLVAAGYAGLTTQRCIDIGATVKACPPKNWDTLYANFQTNGTTAEKGFIATLFTAGEWDGNTTSSTPGFWDLVLTYGARNPQATDVIVVVDPATHIPYQATVSSLPSSGGGGGGATIPATSAILKGDGAGNGAAANAGDVRSALGVTTLSGSNTGDQTSVTGNAGTATKLLTGRTINGVLFDGSGNVTVPAAGSTLTDTVPVSKGGTGTTTPSLVSGTNVTISGTWPNQTVSATGGTGGGASEQTNTDSNVTWVNSTTTLRQSAALTANRTGTLPSAASYNPGTIITYYDQLTSITADYGVSFSPGGTDTLNGAFAAVTFFAGGGTVHLATDGAGAWTQLDTRTMLTALQDGTDKTKQAVFNLASVGSGETRSIYVLSGTTPTATIQTGAGTGASATITGSAKAGMVTINYGTSPTASTAMVHVAATYPIAPTVTLTPHNQQSLTQQSASSHGITVANESTTGWDLMIGPSTGGIGGTTATFTYGIEF